MTLPEMADLAKKCLRVAKDELNRSDMAVVDLFIKKTDKILSAMTNNTSAGVNSSLIIQPKMCDWYDLESILDQQSRENKSSDSLNK